MLNFSEQFFNQIEKCERPLIVFAASWSGDAVASSLALFLLLQKLKKEANITAVSSAKSPVWSFLPATNNINSTLDSLREFIISLDISRTKADQIKYNIADQKINFLVTPKNGWFKPEDITTSGSSFKYDLIIALGATDLESLGQIYDNNVEFFYQTTIINLDCQSGNEDFGQVNIVDLNSASIAETLFNLFQKQHLDLIDEDIATCLLTGIISGTKNFRTPNLTPRTLLTTSKLISLGGRREEIIERLYHSRNFKTLKLWGKILNNLNTSVGGQIVWSVLKRSDFKDAEALEDSLLDIIDELIVNIPEAKIITIIFENPITDKNKILIYTIKNINALEMLKEYSPSGNFKTAQAEVTGNLETISQKYLSDLEIKLKNITQ